MRERQANLDAAITGLRADEQAGAARVLETLAEVPLLASVPLDELRRLAVDVRETVFPEGTEVVREGDDDGVGFFVVVAGEATVHVDGNEVGFVGPGGHFGALASIDGGARTATVRATTELRCLILTDAAFHELVHDNPGVAWKLLLYLAGLVRAQAGADATS
jgi:CRP/FNR family transcriptional regulator, cyclic AMP receptor protein